MAVLSTEGPVSYEVALFVPWRQLKFENVGLVKGLTWASSENSRNSCCARKGLNSALKILEKGLFELLPRAAHLKSSTDLLKKN